METSPPIIAADNVSFDYDGIPALAGLSFSVDAGDYVGVIGPNGGGKTTLVRILLGLLAPSSGTVTVLGRPTTSSQDRHLIGYVPQRIAQGAREIPATVAEIVESGRTATLGLWRRYGAHDAVAVERAMQKSNIMHLRQRRVVELSGGELQRVFIARALAAEPRVLILDEPTVGVDFAAQEKFYAFLKELNQRDGITILFVTHDIDVIARKATTVLCLNHGLVCYGAPSDLIKAEYMAELYGKGLQFVRHQHKAS